MEDTGLKELIQELENDKSKEKVGLELRYVKFGWIIVNLTLIVAIATSILSIIKLSDFINSPEQKITVLNYAAVISGIIFFVVYFIIEKISNHQVVKNVYKQQTNLTKVYKSLDSTISNLYTNNESLEEKIISLNTTITSLDEKITKVVSISENIKKAPLSNLISWGDAGNIETLAKKVWAVSYSLRWLDDKRTGQILKELKMYQEHEYHFILVKEDPVERDAIYTKINNKIIDFDRINETSIKDRFIIKKINQDNLLIPIANDIAIYQSFIDDDATQDIVVINTHEFCDNNSNHEIKDEDLDNNFDFRFKKDIQVSRLKIWYENFWNNANMFEND